MAKFVQYPYFTLYNSLNKQPKITEWKRPLFAYKVYHPLPAGFLPMSPNSPSPLSQQQEPTHINDMQKFTSKQNKLKGR